MAGVVRCMKAPGGVLQSLARARYLGNTGVLPLSAALPAMCDRMAQPQVSHQPSRALLSLHNAGSTDTNDRGTITYALLSSSVSFYVVQPGNARSSTHGHALVPMSDSPTATIQ